VVTEDLQGYQEILEARGQLDFDDLVVRTEQLLRTRSDVATEIAARWSYILVGEAQDLNPFQYRILHRLAQDHHNIFMVGDDEQSIFSWTGADPKILRRFLNDYGITAAPIVLDENRRCSREIFTTARRLVAHNTRLHDKELNATRESPWPVLVRPSRREGTDSMPPIWWWTGGELAGVGAKCAALLQ
jgi:DNA helicase-2/ATP-dependent DNA helicase PcrA